MSFDIDMTVTMMAKTWDPRDSWQSHMLTYKRNGKAFLQDLRLNVRNDRLVGETLVPEAPRSWMFTALEDLLLRLAYLFPVLYLTNTLKSRFRVVSSGSRTP